jgi:hypothetical protein
MFVSVKLCDLVGFPTIPGKNSKYVILKILVFAGANRLLAGVQSIARALKT